MESGETYAWRRSGIDENDKQRIERLMYGDDQRRKRSN